MATAKRDLTNPPVQGPDPRREAALDKLLAIAQRVALRQSKALEDGTQAAVSIATGTDNLADREAS